MVQYVRDIVRPPAARATCFDLRSNAFGGLARELLAASTCGGALLPPRTHRGRRADGSAAGAAAAEDELLRTAVHGWQVRTRRAHGTLRPGSLSDN